MLNYVLYADYLFLFFLPVDWSSICFLKIQCAPEHELCFMSLPSANLVTSYDGRQTCSPDQTMHPESLQDIISAVKLARSSNLHLRVRGNVHHSHSYSPFSNLLALYIICLAVGVGSLLSRWLRWEICVCVGGSLNEVPNNKQNWNLVTILSIIIFSWISTYISNTPITLPHYNNLWEFK